MYKTHPPNNDCVQFVNKKKRNKNFSRVLIELVNKTIDKKIVACYNMVPKSPFSVFYLYLYYIDGQSATANFANLYNIKKGNPEDGIGRKGNALGRKKHVT